MGARLTYGEALRGAASGMRVIESRWLGTRELYRWCGDHIVCHSFNALMQMQAGVVWHDTPQHCPTWTGDAPELGGRCSCDVEGT